MPPSSGDDADDEGASANSTAAADAASDGTTAAESDASDDTAEVDVDTDAKPNAEAALSSALEAADGDPECALCSKPADYFLYEPGSVEKFVCWEHVSPHSAAVDGENARPGRPVALSL